MTRVEPLGFGSVWRLASTVLGHRGFSQRTPRGRLASNRSSNGYLKRCNITEDRGGLSV